MYVPKNTTTYIQSYRKTGPIKRKHSPAENACAESEAQIDPHTTNTRLFFFFFAQIGKKHSSLTINSIKVMLYISATQTKSTYR